MRIIPPALRPILFLEEVSQEISDIIYYYYSVLGTFSPNWPENVTVVNTVVEIFTVRVYLRSCTWLIMMKSVFFYSLFYMRFPHIARHLRLSLPSYPDMKVIHPNDSPDGWCCLSIRCVIFHHGLSRHICLITEQLFKFQSKWQAGIQMKVYSLLLPMHHGGVERNYNLLNWRFDSLIQVRQRPFLFSHVMGSLMYYVQKKVPTVRVGTGNKWRNELA